MDRIIEYLTSICLIFPNVSISLRNEQSGNLLVQTHRCDSIETTFANLFPTYGNPLDRIEVQNSDGRILAECLVGKIGYVNDCLQFWYLNRRPIRNCNWKRWLNRKFEISTIVYPKNRRKESEISYPTYLILLKIPNAELLLNPAVGGGGCGGGGETTAEIRCSNVDEIKWQLEEKLIEWFTSNSLLLPDEILNQRKEFMQKKSKKDAKIKKENHEDESPGKRTNGPEVQLRSPKQNDAAELRRICSAAVDAAVL